MPNEIAGNYRQNLLIDDDNKQSEMEIAVYIVVLKIENKVSLLQFVCQNEFVSILSSFNKCSFKKHQTIMQDDGNYIFLCDGIEERKKNAKINVINYFRQM